MTDKQFRPIEATRTAAEAAAERLRAEKDAAAQQATADFERDVVRLLARLRSMVNPAIDEAVSHGQKRAVVWNSHWNHTPDSIRELKVARAAWSRLAPDLEAAGYRPGSADGNDPPFGSDDGGMHGDYLDLWVEW